MSPHDVVSSIHVDHGLLWQWITDCFGIRFILTYKDNNPAVLWLQMRLVCWDCDIVHRSDFYLIDANYWLRLGADLCFDLLL